MSATTPRAKTPAVLLRENEIRNMISVPEARVAVSAAFACLAKGEAVLPAVMDIDLVERRGEFHAKGAYLNGARTFCLKTASGFFGNADKGLPVNSGLFLAFDAESGHLRAILLDNGFLTDIRTGASGGLAADFLAKKTVRTVAIIGAGVQGRYQLEALLDVRAPDLIRIYDLDTDKADRYAAEMSARGLPIKRASSAESAVTGADIVVTTTPAREAYLSLEWLSPGCHVTAMGADMPAKRELRPDVLAGADKVIVDSLAQCLTQGELHHAVAEGALRAEDVHAEIGEIVAGLKTGRTSEVEITVADLTGVGVQDAAVAEHVVLAAERQGAGRPLDTL
jgi:ornithine cyclodeaminase/alanine dehydrogenase-like protein (mu-crystallin family)